MRNNIDLLERRVQYLSEEVEELQKYVSIKLYKEEKLID